MEKFDLLNVPLQGTNLLEAAAGTGKTYAIEGLYLRLLIESGLPVGEILVVTYTVAATEELRDRIRQRLRAAREAVARGASADPLLAALLAKFPGLPERRRIEERLGAALRDFDEAAIYTIHSFCQRILQENAFESDVLFDRQLITDERQLREEVVLDFWRTHLYETLPEVAGHALERRFDPPYLMNLMGKVTSCPGLTVIPAVAPPAPAALREELASYNGAFAELVATWPRVRSEVYGLLSGPALQGNVYGRKVPSLMLALDAFVRAGGPYFPLFGDFAKFTASKVAAKVKKNHQVPEHAFFRLCQALQERAAALTLELDAYLLSLKAEFVRTARQMLAGRKEKDHLMFFDDLLVNLQEALEKPGGEELARILRKKYRAALIDEFQDTDPVQFAIFARVFGQGQEAQPLFLIGDPKQAIYSFRGADIFAYLRAARGVSGRYHLTENWRAEPGLIGAVNALFSQHGNPFVYEEISFRPAAAPAGKEYEYLSLGGRREAPFQWWFLPAEKYGAALQPLSREKAEAIIAAAVAGEIARLLALSRRGEARLGERPLQPEHIAVLVRKHREARLIQEALRCRNIPAVLQKSGNIFDTQEAEELERVLRACARPEAEPLVRAALLTELLGVSLAELGSLLEDDRAWEARLARFALYRNLWSEAGFMGMFTALLAGEEIKVRLLALADGERRVTNLLQLADLLHQTGEERQFGLPGLVQWFAEQRHPDTPRRDEHQLRLESDEKAVQIITIHQSKGLEYPVVFCPFTWEGSEVKGDAVSFHGRDGAESLILDLGSEEVALSRACAARELLAENCRLLYVALTRAKNRCYFLWGRFNKAETAAPAYLFHGPEPLAEARDGEGMAEVPPEACGRLDDAALYRRLEEIASQSAGAIDLKELPPPGVDKLSEGGATGELMLRPFSGRVDRAWRIVSFSSLLSDRPHLAENPDYDGTATAGEMTVPSPPVFGTAGEAAAADREGAPDIFSFPLGARAGVVLHDILRFLDFREDKAEVLRGLVSQKLRERGFAPLWEEAVLAMLGKVVTVPLLPFTGVSEASFCLASLAPGDRLNELEFYFPLNRFAPRDLQNIFARAGVALPPSSGGDPLPDFSLALQRLQFNPAQGFLKGFMDLVFCWAGRYYLVDWKSNFLGVQATDYGQEALGRTMGEHFYFLQYHLYTLALHQYLTVRLPGYGYERHFGGVYYLFLRGIDPAQGPHYGVYRDRPPEGLIIELAERLIDK